MRSIPRRLLIHKVMLHKKAKEDKWGNVTLDDGVELSFVRMEPSKQIIREIQLSATLFFDCKNSKPRCVKFDVDDIVIFHGEKHRVKMVEPLHDERRLHHYGMGLIKSS